MCFCRGHLVDTVLDWEQELPARDLTLAEYHSLYEFAVFQLLFLTSLHLSILPDVTCAHCAGMPKVLKTRIFYSTC